MDLEPIIGVTMGDAAGIGPEIVLKSLLSGDVSARCIVIGDAKHLASVFFNHQVPAINHRGERDWSFRYSRSKESAGRSSPRYRFSGNGRAAAENIVAAVDLWNDGEDRRHLHGAYKQKGDQHGGV